MPHVQITWVEGRSPEPNARIFMYRFTIFHRQITPKPACW